MDKDGGTREALWRKGPVVERVQAIVRDWTLVDCWRELHPTTRQFTWEQPHPAVKCRLDYWLLPADLLIQTVDCKIRRFIRTDHKSVSIRIQGPRFRPRGPGLWRLNTSLLQLDAFKATIVESIRTAMTDTEGWDPASRWEFIKMSIRNAAMENSAKVNSRRKARKQELIQLLDVAQDPSMLVDEEQLALAQLELEAMTEADARRAISKSRVRWLVKGGKKPNRYFLGMEKRNQVRKTITKLLAPDGQELSDTKELLRTIQAFFSTVYLAPPGDPALLDNWFDTWVPNHGRCLGEDAKMALERPLELWELTHAVKGMNGGKTPGRDGLPVEFYRALWADIQQPYMDAISASLHSGQLGQSLTQGVITLIPKPGKDPSRLNNWRPITLLNCD